jgi:hypothetical protein
MFFVISFSTEPKVIVPLVAASPSTRSAASRAVGSIEATNLTFMSKALRAASREFAKAPGAVCQLMLLTDGQNDEDDRRDLDHALTENTGKFQAHCRGVGTDWSVKQLRDISERLLGTVKLVARPEGLAKDFQDTLAAAQSKAVADVRLRFRTLPTCQLVAFKQSFPQEIDLTSKLVQVDPRTLEVQLGDFGAEAQEYFATFKLTPSDPGTDYAICRASVWAFDPATRQLAEAGKAPPLTVQWTDDASLSARIDKTVAHYSGQAEKAAAIQEGLEALAANDMATATVRLGRAAQLAAASGDDETTIRLSKVVDVVDAEAGTVAIRRGHADTAALMDLDAGSTRAVRAATKS